MKTDDKTKQELSDFLREAQKLLNMSNKDIADILHCQPNNVSQIKNPEYWKMISQSVWDYLIEWKKERSDVYAMMHPALLTTTNPTVVRKEIQSKIGEPYEIEHGVTIPPPSKGSNFFLYPLEKMKVGDSFKVPIILNEKPKSIYSRIQTAISRYRKEHIDHKFTIRTIYNEQCIRCWRTE